MAKNPELSIIILSYNTKDLIVQCLNSLQEAIYNLDSEIIVVDNGSTDGSVEYLKKLQNSKYSKLQIVFNKKNLGYAKANNQGLKKAQGKYILFLNSDTIVPKKTIQELLSYLGKNPRVGVVTPRLKLRDGRLDPDCHRGFPTPWASLCYFAGLERVFPKSKVFGQYHKFFLPMNKIHEIDACCGAFLLTRKEILEKIGGFDESYFFYGEDLDLCYRIKKTGWRIVYYPKVSAVHYKGASSGLRRETEDITQVDKATRLKIAKASIKAMEIFYNKFYKNKYPWYITAFVILGIKTKGLFRYLKCLLKSL